MGEPERRDVSDPMNGAIMPVVTNGNGHHPVPAPPLPVVAYQPKARDWKFLQAVQEAIEQDGRLSHEAIANRLGVTRQAVTKRLQDAEFEAWINERLERAVDALWPKVMMRATRLALRGSIDHMNFLAKVGGRFKQGDGAPAAGGPTVNVLIRV